MRFKWTEWNRAHIARRPVVEREAEEAIRARRSTHHVRRDGTAVTEGRTKAGRHLFVVWREEEATDILAVLESVIFVITAFEVD